MRSRIVNLLIFIVMIICIPAFAASGIPDKVGNIKLNIPAPSYLKSNGESFGMRDCEYDGTIYSESPSLEVVYLGVPLYEIKCFSYSDKVSEIHGVVRGLTQEQVVEMIKKNIGSGASFHGSMWKTKTISLHVDKYDGKINLRIFSLTWGCNGKE